jgi:hypothetical protein
MADLTKIEKLERERDELRERLRLTQEQVQMLLSMNLEMERELARLYVNLTKAHVCSRSTYPVGTTRKESA